MERTIIHVDMDEFFAAVEKLDHPELRGKPLLIGAPPESRGVVATASYEARRFGCHSAMPMARALRLCPQAIVLPPRFDRYSQVSQQVFAILEQFTPLLEKLSIDEAFLDVTGCQRLMGDGRRIAEEIKRRIRQDVGLTASVGVAPNKFLAKIASDLRKPDGLVVIEEGQIHDVLDPLPVGKLWGVGPATEKQFAKLNIRTIGHLRRTPLEALERVLGRHAEHYLQLANGIDDRPVEPAGEPKSIGQEETFPADIGDLEQLTAVLLRQVQEVASRLRRHRLLARTVTLKLRYADFTTITRSRTLDDATDETARLSQEALSLLAAWAEKSLRPLRLLGVTACNFAHGGRQLSLFEENSSQKLRRLDAALDDIAKRFGSDAVQRGRAKKTDDDE